MFLHINVFLCQFLFLPNHFNILPYSRSHIVIWLGLDRCRLITATIAWCLSCVLVYGELRARYRLELRRLRTEQTLKQWRWKVDELSGQPDVFEPLMRIQAGERMALSAASGSLRKLIAMHQVCGYE